MIVLLLPPSGVIPLCCQSFEVVVRAPWQLRRATSREAGRRVLLVREGGRG